jgi:fructosamine-3-kinase
MKSANDLAVAVGDALRGQVLSVVETGGGGISATYRVTIDGGRAVFVKTISDASPGMYTAEAEGLAWLAETRAVRVPEVLAVNDDDAGLVRRFLVLTWIDQHLPAPDHDEQLGRDLARLHSTQAPSFGLDRDNYIADLPQSNTPHDSWAEFYRAERLEPLLRRAIDAGLLPTDAINVFDRLLAILPELVGPPEPPARLHGDLWRGNVLAGLRGEPWLVDPAVYGGHREMDLAMMKLFGGFGDRCYTAYDEAFPLADGHEERVPLCQLYPLLVHVVMFGGGYASSVMQAARRYVD